MSTAPSLPAGAAALAAQPAPAMTARLWSTINDINQHVNRQIARRSDLRSYGVSDYWATPLENGGQFGDCEDYVLEKERRLVAAGFPPSALNIALVRISSGETHAVLIVSTQSGDYMMDSLSPWVEPWRRSTYTWGKRQLNGAINTWAMVDASAGGPAT